MTDPLFLADLAHTGPGDTVLVCGEEGRHAVVVRRIRVGEKVLLSDGEGAGVRGEVLEAGRDGMLVRVDEVLDPTPRPLRVVAVQALAKGERSDIAVEALTEIGADEILAWQAARSVVRWDAKIAKGVAKWSAFVLAATKQSRRLRIPPVSYASTQDVCRRLEAADLALVLHEDATEDLRQVAVPAAGECVLVVGPEGGISRAELDAFLAAGARTVRVSDAVLRTSTAGVVAVAQLEALRPRT